MIQCGLLRVICSTGKAAKNPPISASVHCCQGPDQIQRAGDRLVLNKWSCPLVTIDCHSRSRCLSRHSPNSPSVQTLQGSEPGRGRPGRCSHRQDQANRCLYSPSDQDDDERRKHDVLLACCKRIPGRSPSFPSLITFCSQGNLFPSSLFLPCLPSSQGNLLFSPTFPSCFPEPARKLLPTFSGESRRPDVGDVPSPFWKLDPPGEISRGPRSSDEYGCCTGE